MINLPLIVNLTIGVGLGIYLAGLLAFLTGVGVVCIGMLVSKLCQKKK